MVTLNSGMGKIGHPRHRFLTKMPGSKATPKRVLQQTEVQAVKHSKRIQLRQPIAQSCDHGRTAEPVAGQGKKMGEHVRPRSFHLAYVINR
jgi:hypothetical protein